MGQDGGDIGGTGTPREGPLHAVSRHRGQYKRCFSWHAWADGHPAGTSASLPTLPRHRPGLEPGCATASWGRPYGGRNGRWWRETEARGSWDPTAPAWEPGDGASQQVRGCGDTKAWGQATLPASHSPKTPSHPPPIMPQEHPAHPSLTRTLLGASISPNTPIHGSPQHLQPHRGRGDPTPAGRRHQSTPPWWGDIPNAHPLEPSTRQPTQGSLSLTPVAHGPWVKAPP